MRRKLSWVAAFFSITLTIKPSFAEQEPVTPVLVELFTSEGCSSCPPADRLLANLKEERGAGPVKLIVLSEHVNYWDNLGWPDPFASQTITERQQQYARHFNKNCYTPQMVVDGTYEFVGSNSRLANDAINQASKVAKAKLSVKVKAASSESAQLAVDFQPSSGSKSRTAATAELFVAEVADNLSSTVKSGENNGRQLNHTAVVIGLNHLKQINGNEPFTSTVQIKRSKNQTSKKTYFVCFAQMTDSKKIFAVTSSQ